MIEPRLHAILPLAEGAVKARPRHRAMDLICYAEAGVDHMAGTTGRRLIALGGG